MVKSERRHPCFAYTAQQLPYLCAGHISGTLAVVIPVVALSKAVVVIQLEYESTTKESHTNLFVFIRFSQFLAMFVVVEIIFYCFYDQKPSSYLGKIRNLLKTGTIQRISRWAWPGHID